MAAAHDREKGHRPFFAPVAVNLCAAGYNIRWLLRMIVKKGIGLFLRLLQLTGLHDFARALRKIIMSNQLKSSAMHWANS